MRLHVSHRGGALCPNVYMEMAVKTARSSRILEHQVSQSRRVCAVPCSLDGLSTQLREVFALGAATEDGRFYLSSASGVDLCL